MKSVHQTARAMSEDEWFQAYRDHSTKARGDLVPFPAEDIQVVTNSLKGLVTADDAISIWETIKGSIEAHRTITPDMKILDYGCGWGRVTRLLLRDFEDQNVYGADVNDDLIASAKDCVPSIDFAAIESMKPLPYASETFDLIFAVSVFSHLSERSAVSTLKELARITKPGGLLVLSVLEHHEMVKFFTNNEDQKKWITTILGSFDEAEATLKADGFVWGDTRRWPDYGIAIMTHEWFANLYAENGLEMLASTRSPRKDSQNYKVGRKR